MPKQPDIVSLIEDGRRYHIRFNPQGWISEVILETPSKKVGIKHKTVWKRIGGQNPLSPRSASAMERAITAREKARWDETSQDWTYPGKA